MLRTRVILGAVLGIIAALVLYYAWRDDDLIYGLVGALTVVSALLFFRSATLAGKPAPLQTAEPAPIFRPQEETVYRPPLLGELLVHKYRRISSDTLAAALDMQRGTTRPLGEVLLSMGEIDPNDLDLALADQERYKDGSWTSEPWALRRVESRPGFPSSRSESRR